MKLTRLIAAALTAVCIFTLTSCKQEDTQTTANDYPVHVADTVVDHRPKKVVSLAPALTDTLFQLQIAGRVVAISDYCDPVSYTHLQHHHTPGYRCPGTALHRPGLRNRGPAGICSPGGRRSPITTPDPTPVTL